MPQPPRSARARNRIRAARATAPWPLHHGGSAPGRHLCQGTLAQGRRLCGGTLTLGLRLDDGTLTLGRRLVVGTRAFGQRLSGGTLTLGRRLRDGILALGRRLSDDTRALGRLLRDGILAFGRHPCGDTLALGRRLRDGALGLAVAGALAAAGPAAATQEYILPTLFDVTGVASDDVLNIRARPDAGSPVIGTLAPDAERIEVVAHDPSGAWARVNTRERSGWVALRYLAYRTDVWEPGALPPDLHCAGTEPFWSLQPEGDAIVLSRAGLDDRRFERAEVLDTGVFRDPRRAVTATEAGGAPSPGAGAALVASIVPMACSDGMSDRAYGLDLSVVLRHGDGAELLTGCCSIAPR